MKQYTINPPRLLIAATQSGSGKTAVTSGIMAALRRRGYDVRAYKVGPDYIDPGYLSAASGRPVQNLDTWLTDRQVMTRIFAETSAAADIVFVEGVMGLYDGGKNGMSSSAEIAKILKLPVVLVIDAKSMGQSAAAIAMGFRDYDPDVSICGVILNRLGSENHRRMICEAFRQINIPVLGSVFRSESMLISERHLGLLPEQENSDKNRISAIADVIERSVDIGLIIEIANKSVPIKADMRSSAQAAAKVKIGIARDEAFSFYYQESFAELERAGAELFFFSPLHDEYLPDVDGIIFGGGFPEIFAEGLSANESMKKNIYDAASDGIPIYAECGGFMYLTEYITDFNGKRFRMSAVIPASCSMGRQLQKIGYIEARALKDTVICRSGTVIRGHEFHFSTDEPGIEPSAFPWAFSFCRTSSGDSCMSGYASGSVLASYLHISFSGCPELVSNFVAHCLEYHNKKSIGSGLKNVEY